MIQFYRTIRYRLMNEGRVSKYLKYAAGEIMLVMIGILLALQVNNWNESRKEKALEKKLLVEYRSELEYNYEMLENGKQIMTDRATKTALLLKYIEEKLPFADSLNNYFIVLSIGVGESKRSVAAFNAIEVKGMDQIQDDELKNMITNLHAYYYKTIDHRLENLMLNIRDYGRPIIRTKFRSLGDAQHTPISYDEIMSDVTFLNTIRVLGHNYRDLHEVMTKAQNRIKEVVKKIDQYIE